MKYVKKPEYADALQFTGTPENIQEFVEFTGSVGVVYGPGGIVSAQAGGITLVVGEWLAKETSRTGATFFKDYSDKGFKDAYIPA